jgi:hypothetical protein
LLTVVPKREQRRVPQVDRASKGDPMDTSIFLPVLTFGTMFAVIVFALVSKERTERRRKDPDAPKSTLASDAPDEHQH